jgi:hypothetical protein
MVSESGKAMRKPITLDLPEGVEAELASASRDENLSPSEIVTAALNDYLFVRKFRRLREKMRSQSPQLYSDDEILEQVS